MPIRVTGPICPRRGCRRPASKDDLCARCWRLAHLFGRDPLLFAYEPLDGYRDALDTVDVDWDRWDREGRFGFEPG